MATIVGACNSAPAPVAPRPGPIARPTDAAASTDSGPGDAGPSATHDPTGPTREPMWDAVSNREIYWRWPSGTCEKWQIAPEGFPANYEGVVTHAEPDGTRFALRYDGGDPPKLDAPSVTRGDFGDAGAAAKLAIACDDAAPSAGRWYLSADACARGGDSSLTPAGCAGVLRPDARAALVATLSGQPREALARAIRRASSVWVADGCSRRVVRPASSVYVASSGFRALREHALLPDGPMLLDDPIDAYPWLLMWTTMGFVFGEVAEKNPDYQRGRGEGIGLGCCEGPTHFVVNAFVDGVAELVREEVTEKKGTVRKRERWWIERAPPAEVLRGCKR